MTVFPRPAVNISKQRPCYFSSRQLILLCRSPTGIRHGNPSQGLQLELFAPFKSKKVIFFGPLQVCFLLKI